MIALGKPDALRQIDAGMTAEQISKETTGGKIDQVLRAEQFHAHDGTGQRGVGSTGKHSDKTDPSQQINRNTCLLYTSPSPRDRG